MPFYYLCFGNNRYAYPAAIRHLIMLLAIGTRIAVSAMVRELQKENLYQRTIEVEMSSIRGISLVEQSWH